MRPRVLAVAYRGEPSSTDAILAYSRRLCAALDGSDGFRGVLALGTADRTWRLGEGDVVGSLATVARGVDGVLLQYNPFSYGRWGFAPWLIRDLRRVRKAGIPVGVMIHEAFLRPLTRRQHLLRAWQRRQLQALLGTADVVFAATPALLETVAKTNARVPTHHLPVGSNLPDARGARTGMRRRLELGPADLAVAAFGTGHHSQLTEWVARAAAAVARSGRRTVVLNLGAGAPPVTGVPDTVRVLSPGELSEQELAEWLAAADLFVAPFSDGVSTRRTTLMAALQHELPVVGTRGPSTGPILAVAPEALSLVDVGDPEGMETIVERLVADPVARRELARAGRRLYEEHFDWQVIAGTVSETLVAAWARRGAAAGRR